MRVTEEVNSGLTNAYRSVPSACGSFAIKGASRWLDASVNAGAMPIKAATSSSARVTAKAVLCLTSLCMSLFLSADLLKIERAKVYRSEQKFIALRHGPPFQVRRQPATANKR